MQAEIDHLVVAAATLEQGAAWCEATLGVAPGPGGRHALMGTHNRLLAISGPRFERAYLEIIALDPAAPSPSRPRWFGLDDPALRSRLAASPRLWHAVVRSPQLDMHRWGLVQCGLQPGEPLAMARDTERGTLRWQILVPADGARPAGGALPTLIQWQGPHPCERLPASGVVLEALDIDGMPPRAREVLRLRHAGGDDARPPRIVARLLGPRGPVTLESDA